MKKLLIEMKIIGNGMRHHMAETFFQVQVFLSAVIAKIPGKGIAAVKAVFLIAMLFHCRLKSGSIYI